MLHPTTKHRAQKVLLRSNVVAATCGRQPNPETRSHLHVCHSQWALGWALAWRVANEEEACLLNENVQNATHYSDYFIVEAQIEFYSRIKAFGMAKR